MEVQEAMHDWWALESVLRGVPEIYRGLGHRPALAYHGLDVLVGLRVVGDMHLGRVVLYFAFDAQGDYSEQNPLGHGSGDAEIGTGGVAAFAGANPIAVVAGRTRQQLGGE